MWLVGCGADGVGRAGGAGKRREKSLGFGGALGPEGGRSRSCIWMGGRLPRRELQAGEEHYPCGVYENAAGRDPLDAGQ